MMMVVVVMTMMIMMFVMTMMIMMFVMMCHNYNSFFSFALQR